MHNSIVLVSVLLEIGLADLAAHHIIPASSFQLVPHRKEASLQCCMHIHVDQQTSSELARLNPPSIIDKQRRSARSFGNVNVGSGQRKITGPFQFVLSDNISQQQLGGGVVACPSVLVW